MVYNDCIKPLSNKEKIVPVEPTNNQRSDSQNSKEGGTFCCMDCGKRFATHGAYLLHLKEVHGI